MIGRVTREIFARERVPARARWWLAAAGMRDFLRVMARGLEPHLGDRTRPVLTRLVGHMFTRRYLELRRIHPHLPDPASQPRGLALVMAGLYRAPLSRRRTWIFDGVGGGPTGAGERARSALLIARLSPEARWRELAVHLGELLIVLTEELPAELPRARQILAELCFASGAHYARRMKRALALPDPPDDAAARALEVLRVSEYLFRVNPEHWGETDAATRTGYLEGTACPWWDRPGWTAGHCGIFGQFQNGVCSEFGLKYRLSQTIPKHGGTTCRIDVAPIAPSTLLRRARDGEPSTSPG